MNAHALRQAIDSATGYLLSRQEADGHWRDYRLPVGHSDAWVTGYVGLALADAAGPGEAPRPCLAAAVWLAGNRPYPAGWGYNGRTGPDADSTAFALGLLGRCAIATEGMDHEWLRQRWQADGGFATYPRDDAWGEAHGDVTPVAYMAMPEAERAALRAPVQDFLRRHRQADGTWPSYWWRTSHYATYWSLRLVRALGWPADGRAPAVRDEETHAIHSLLDLALVTGIADLQGAPAPLTARLAGLLLEKQRGDGAWPGGPNLRVTDPDCRAPWVDARGALYTDTNHLITTATALAVLARLKAGHGAPPYGQA